MNNQNIIDFIRDTHFSH